MIFFLHVIYRTLTRNIKMRFALLPRNLFISPRYSQLFIPNALLNRPNPTLGELCRAFDIGEAFFVFQSFIPNDYSTSLVSQQVKIKAKLCDDEDLRDKSLVSTDICKNFIKVSWTSSWGLLFACHFPSGTLISNNRVKAKTCDKEHLHNAKLPSHITFISRKIDADYSSVKMKNGPFPVWKSLSLLPIDSLPLKRRMRSVGFDT